MSPRLGWIGDPLPDTAEWLAPYPYPDAGPRGQWLADRYPHTLRVLHPAYLDTDGESQPVTWAQIAAAVGTEMTVGAQLSEIVGAWFPETTGLPDPSATIEGTFDTAPEMGSLPPELINVLFNHFDDAQAGLFWTGWGEFLDEPIRGSALVSEGPDGLDYQVVTTTRSSTQSATRMRTPNFWWPADHTWCAATGIDEVDTLVVSTDLGRLESVHANPALETQLYSR
ncbi:hypothetical protein [Rhodococcus sp. IEGM 1379]|uniref:hypothetical protein n=1 Tax=Rhodococcus sp. IEGM 1379 TaxID=3047086 RepID=UPI0024B78740|nr:hypothetical protein [Rhodococcus sp. IEGM 1379]MDI9918716.1 hypothetical protein [Rhodococcus sp. IEGM 1379]